MPTKLRRWNYRVKQCDSGEIYFVRKSCQRLLLRRRVDISSWNPHVAPKMRRISQKGIPVCNLFSQRVSRNVRASGHTVLSRLFEVGFGSNRGNSHPNNNIAVGPWIWRRQSRKNPHVHFTAHGSRSVCFVSNSTAKSAVGKKTNYHVDWRSACFHHIAPFSPPCQPIPCTAHADRTDRADRVLENIGHWECIQKLSSISKPNPSLLANTYDEFALKIRTNLPLLSVRLLYFFNVFNFIQKRYQRT